MSPEILLVAGGLGTAWSLVAACAYAVISGKLVPRSTLDDSIKREDRAWVVADRWEATAKTNAETISEVLPAIRGVSAQLDAIPRAIGLAIGNQGTTQ